MAYNADIASAEFRFGPRDSLVVTAQNIVFRNGLLRSLQVDGLEATRVDDELAWGKGDIRSTLSERDQLRLGSLVLSSVSDVAQDELPYSACTDGRLPVSLGDSSIVPVRRQVVGASPMAAFAGAEALGERFYPDPTVGVMKRFEYLLGVLSAHKIVPSTHNGCGGRESFAAIMRLGAALMDSNTADAVQYRARHMQMVGEQNHRADWDEEYLKQVKLRLNSYREYNHVRAEQMIKRFGSDHGFTNLSTDGGGVHGHTESAVYHLGDDLHNSGIDERLVFGLGDGAEVFSITRGLINDLAVVLGNGSDKDKIGRAKNAMHHFTSAAHGALAQGLPSFVVSRLKS